MPRIIFWSLLTLVMIFFIARSCGLTPEQVEGQILLADLNTEEGAEFRRQNAARPGVMSLPSGLQVEVLEAGDGEIPLADDWVQLHYRGWHIDGREFDNSRRRGEVATVTVSSTIPGWQAALASMPVGSSVRLVVPPDLAYGRPGAGIIGPEETLVFEIELLAILPPDAPIDVPEWEKPVPNLR